MDIFGIFGVRNNMKLNYRLHLTWQNLWISYTRSKLWFFIDFFFLLLTWTTGSVLTLTRSCFLWLQLNHRYILNFKRLKLIFNQLLESSNIYFSRVLVFSLKFRLWHLKASWDIFTNALSFSCRIFKTSLISYISIFFHLAMLKSIHFG